ncbi:MAG: DUF1007 family protein [Thiotrichaceae bacterium]|nr:DUF1007 family protein [Thiotrichaceae bacterium]
MKSIITILTLYTFLAFFPVTSSAEHFHYDIALQSEFNLEGKQLKSVKMVWVYDEIISAMMLESEKDTKNLQSFADYLLNDLSKVNYFTTIKQNDKPVKIGKASKPTLKIISDDKKTELQLSFELPLAKAISIEGKQTLRIINFDHSGSAILFYKDATSLKLGAKLKSRCTPFVKDKKDFEHGEPSQFVEIRCKK